MSLSPRSRIAAVAAVSVALFASRAWSEPDDALAGGWSVAGKDAHGGYKGSAQVQRLQDGRYEIDLTIVHDGGKTDKASFVGKKSGAQLTGRRAIVTSFTGVLAGDTQHGTPAVYKIAQDGSTLEGTYGTASETLSRAPATTTTSGSVAKITILHTNDIHGQLRPLQDGTSTVGGIAALAARLRKERDAAKAQGQSVITLDAGDIYAGTPEGDLTDGVLPLDLMTLIGYDAMAIGNHEFDRGVPKLKALVAHAKFPVLAANLVDTTTGAHASWTGSSVVLDVAGMKVCVIGLLTKDLKSVTTTESVQGVDVQDEALAGDREIEAHPEAKAFILLTHCGEPDDEQLAAHFHGRVAAIVGGHTHTPIKAPHKFPAGADDGVLVTQAGKQARFVGRIDLALDRETGKVISAEGKLLDVRPQDGEAPDVVAALEKEGKAIADEMDKPIGKLTKPLLRSAPGSSALGNLLADLCRDAGKADVGFMNKTGVRVDLNAGTVTLRAIYQVWPFDIPVEVMTLTGKDLRDLLEEMLSSGLLLETSGLVVKFDTSKPKGQQVVDVQVGGKPLDPKKTYTVAENEFLAEGGDGHSVFTRGTGVKSTGKKIIDLMKGYFQGKTITPGPIDQRLVDVAH